MIDNIKRIQKMETIFDELLENIDKIHDNPILKEKYEFLVSYYTSDLWLEDYTLDEKHQLPPNLKRGVLSQDGIDDLICKVKGENL